MSSELKFSDRFSAVVGNKPYAWGKRKGLEKAFITNCLRSTDRLQQKNLEKLVAATGIPDEWWLHGELPPPPPRELAPVQARTAKDHSRHYMLATEPAPAADFSEINAALQMNCLRALREVHGDEFSAMPALDQMAYAIDLYNLIAKMTAQTGKSLNDALRLEVAGLAEQLRLFLKMGWTKPYPSPLSSIPIRLF